MLAGGMPAVLALVSKVLLENIVARVDCKDVTSENTEDLGEDE